MVGRSGTEGGLRTVQFPSPTPRMRRHVNRAGRPGGGSPSVTSGGLTVSWGRFCLTQSVATRVDSSAQPFLIDATLTPPSAVLTKDVGHETGHTPDGLLHLISPPLQLSSKSCALPL